jgi:hypothetical protein
MKEADSILRISPTLADSLRREIQFSQPDLARALKQSLTADSVLTEQTLVAHKLYQNLAPSPLLKELEAASRAIVSGSLEQLDGKSG